MTQAQINEGLVKQEETKVQQRINLAQAAIIETDMDFQGAGEFRKELRGESKRLDEMEKSATRPMLQSLETVRGWFRPVKEGLKQAMSIMDNKLVAYDRKKEDERRKIEAEAREKARKEQEKLHTKADKQAEAGQFEKAIDTRTKAEEIVTPTVAMPPPPKVAGMHTRETWTYEVTQEDLIPDEYWVVDHKKLGAAVRAFKNAKHIPGIRQFVEKTVASKSR